MPFDGFVFGKEMVSSHHSCGSFFDNAVMKMFNSVVSQRVAYLSTGLNEVEGGATPGTGGSPQIDLAVLTLADHAVLHCPSSFSNVAKRLRDYPHAYSRSADGGDHTALYSSTSFWGVDGSLPTASDSKAEL